MQPRWRLVYLFALAFLGATPTRGAYPGPQPATRNLVLVTTDGLRWQEVFRGAEESLISREQGGVRDVDSLRGKFWRDSSEARRSALMPFFWTSIARHGQVFGNADKGSLARAINGKNVSYPGYSEIFTGAPDPRVVINSNLPNPNINVLEWLNGREDFRGKVAAVGSWEVYPFILNVERSRLPVNAGWMPIAGPAPTRSQTQLNRRMARANKEWKNCRNDVFTFQVAIEHLRRDTPRVLYIGFGDTDEYGHGGRYDRYLRSANHVDRYLKLLWDELQAHPQYRGSTTLIFTTDHGRGDSPRSWREHGEHVKGSDQAWLAVMGPDTPGIGERTSTELVTQGQVAATIAALLGEDYNTAEPRAARPISAVLHPTIVASRELTERYRLPGSLARYLAGAR